MVSSLSITLTAAEFHEEVTPRTRCVANMRLYLEVPTSCRPIWQGGHPDPSSSPLAGSGGEAQLLHTATEPKLDVVLGDKHLASGSWGRWELVMPSLAQRSELLLLSSVSPGTLFLALYALQVLLVNFLIWLHCYPNPKYIIPETH